MPRTPKLIVATLTDASADSLRASACSGDGDARAEALYRVSLDRTHLGRWGFGSVHEWARTELSLAPTAADALRTAWARCTAVGVREQERRRLLDLAPTKLRAIVPALNASNAGAWIDAARQLSASDLARAAREGGEPPRFARTRRLTFSLPDGEPAEHSPYAIVQLALETARRAAETRSEDYALSMICLDYLSGALNDVARLRAMHDRLRSSNRSHPATNGRGEVHAREATAMLGELHDMLGRTHDVDTINRALACLLPRLPRLPREVDGQRALLALLDELSCALALVIMMIDRPMAQSS